MHSLWLLASNNLLKNLKEERGCKSMAPYLCHLFTAHFSDFQPGFPQYSLCKNPKATTALIFPEKVNKPWIVSIFARIGESDISSRHLKMGLSNTLPKQAKQIPCGAGSPG